MLQIQRRSLLLGASALLLAGCGGGATAPRTATRDTGLAPEFRPQPNAGFADWAAAFRGRALAQGITAATFDTAFRGAGYLPGVVARDRRQTEFTRTLEDYLAITASEEKVATGRAKARQFSGTLSQIEAKYGVQASYVAAIWGVESNFGARRGDIPVISATATLAYDGRRGAFFEKQLIAALRILQRGDTTPANMTGSWAGAMGHTQFIPTSYQAFAVDFTGDGRRDIWSEDPTDALASAAAYLSRNGWRRGAVAAQEAPDGSLRPQAGGPAFRTTGNFRVIKTYNNSTNYALGVSYLAHRIAGGGPLKASFGPDANGLTIEDRKLLQQRLTAKGFDTGGSDGVIGPKSEAAIRAYQSSLGVTPTGTPSQDLLNRLRGR